MANIKKEILIAKMTISDEVVDKDLITNKEFKDTLDALEKALNNTSESKL